MNCLSHAQTILLCTDEYLKSNSLNVLLCEGVSDGFYSTIEGLSLKYPEQLYEIPCSESSMIGMALSASSYEVTTLVCLQRVEFALLAIEQLVNNSAKNSFFSGNQRCNPCLFRFVIGRGWGQGPSHSQSCEAIFAHIPDISVLLPVFPADSKLIYSTFSSLNHPCISLEHRWTHFSFDICASKSNTLLTSYSVATGTHLTIIAYSYNVLLANTIADQFTQFGISIEVINLLNISNINYKLITDSINTTGLLILLDLDDRCLSVSSEILGKLALSDRLGCLRKAPVRLSNHGVYCPSSPALSNEYYLKGSEIAQAACDLLDIDTERRNLLLERIAILEAAFPADVPNQYFTGPF